MGMTDFGVSGHADFSMFEPGFGMDDEKLRQYTEELQELREEYRGKMNLYIGIELDGLGPVQKLRDGEALGGSSMTAAQAFGAPQQPTMAAQQPAYAVPQQPAYAAAAAPGYTQPAAGRAPWGQPGTGVNPLTGMPY